jgi:hypothetical protein
MVTYLNSHIAIFCKIDSSNYVKNNSSNYVKKPQGILGIEKAPSKKTLTFEHHYFTHPFKLGAVTFEVHFI